MSTIAKKRKQRNGLPALTHLHFLVLDVMDIDRTWHGGEELRTRMGDRNVEIHGPTFY